MNLTQYIVNFIKTKISPVKKLSENPNADRLIFINDNEKIRVYRTKIGKIWLVGNSSELLNFFTEEQSISYNDNPVYNRNNRNMFWAKSTVECNIHRIHSRVPNAIIHTMNSVMGDVHIEEPSGMWEKIAEANNFNKKLKERARPLCMAEGYGAWKVNINKSFSDYPILEYYDAENVDYIYIGDIFIGVSFKSYYKDDKNKDYVLIENRFKKNKNSYITYELFRLNKNNDITPVPLDTIPNLTHYKEEEMVLPGLDKVLAVPMKYIDSILYPGYGESLLTDYSDLFDMCDEALSQLAQTNRVSTPVTWINPEVMRRGPTGAIGYENLYNRQIMMKEGIPDGEGFQNQDIITEQPQLNFEQYINLVEFVINTCLTGRISPATMGIDIAKKDNALAQREKEKITIETRDAFIESEENMLKELVEICLIVKDFMDNGQITLNDKNITVKYDDYGAPTKEEERQQLLDMLSRGAISPEKFVNDYYDDSLTDAEKLAEIDYIKSQDAKESLEGMFGNDEASTEQFNLPTGEAEEETAE